VRVPLTIETERADAADTPAKTATIASAAALA